MYLKGQNISYKHQATKSYFFHRVRKKDYQKEASISLILLLFFQIISGMFLFVPPPKKVQAATQNWPFTTASDYTYDDTKIEFSSGQAQLKATTTPEWYDISWKYRKKITIDHTKVAGNLTNFPILISRTDTDWKDTTNGGYVDQADGGDFVFTKADGTTKLSHEIETYNNSTGELVAWVKVDFLSSISDTDVYIYYGNVTSADQWDTANVWDSDYAMVQHLKDATTATTTDSTANANNGSKKASNEPIEAAGKIGKAQSFDGSDDYIGVPHNILSEDTLNYSVSAWFNVTGGVGTRRSIFETNPLYTLSLAVEDDGYLKGYDWSLTSANNDGITSISIINGRWYYATLVYEQNQKLKLYVGYTVKDVSVISFFVGNASQGVCTDGIYIYTTSADGLRKYDTDGNLITSNTNILNGFDHAGDLSCYNGKLYIAAHTGDWVDGSTSGVLVFNSSDLSYVEKYNISAGYGAGTICRNSDNGHFYVGESTTVNNRFDHIYEFDSSFNPIATHITTEKSSYGMQGITYRNGKFIITGHENRFYETDNVFNVDREGVNTQFGQLQGVDWLSDTILLMAEQTNARVYKVNLIDAFSTEIFTGTKTITESIYPINHLNIGTYRNADARYFNGGLDEIRISNSARSAEWISTEYNNQNSPSTFYSVSSQEIPYDTNNPSIQPTVDNSLTFTSLWGFTETSIKNGGEIKYQISNDAGITWYWYNSGWTTTSTGYSEANIVADINTNISSFPVGNGSFLFKAYLNSDGSQLVQLGSIDLIYDDVTAPAAFTLSSPTNNSSVSSRSTLSWNATSDSESGINKYQLYIDGVLNRDNISSSADSSSPASDLSCGNHTWYLKAIDNAGNATDSNTYNMSYLCGSVPLYQVTSCSSVVYDDWQTACVNGWQYRNIKSQNPSGCCLTTEQENDRKRQCGSTNANTETTPAPTSETSTSDPLGDIAWKHILNDGGLIATSDVNQLIAEIGVKRDLAMEAKYSRTIVERIVKDTVASNQTRNAITNFVTYGTQTTLSLGAGERAGVVNSFKSAFGKLPTTQEDWEDVIKIANGRWPGQISKTAEDKAVANFKKVYLRNPDRTNPHDDAAITVMAYGLRPANRNLESEAKAIGYFKNIYGYSPKTAMAWDIVRAIAYSGATR